MVIMFDSRTQTEYAKDDNYKVVKESIFQQLYMCEENLMALPNPARGCLGISSVVFTKAADGSLFGFPSRHSRVQCTLDGQNRLDAEEKYKMRMS